MYYPYSAPFPAEPVQAALMRLDRIFLSNVPDYVGLLCAFIHFLPLLGENAVMVHNVLLNCQCWTSLEECVRHKPTQEQTMHYHHFSS